MLRSSLAAKETFQDDEAYKAVTSHEDYTSCCAALLGDVDMCKLVLQFFFHSHIHSRLKKGPETIHL